MATSPVNSKIDLPTFKILVEGQAIKEYYQVVSIHVEKEINRINTSEIVLLDGNPADQNFEISESSDFVPGSKIEIDLGYHSTEEAAFKGIIMSQSIKVRSSPAGVRSELTIRCSDEAVKLTIGRKSRNFKDKKDSDVITSIIGETGVDKSVGATSFTHKKIVQYDSTDWDFILSRAEVNGFVAVCDDGKLKIDAPQLSGQAALGITYGVDAIDFQAELDSVSQLTAVECTSWDSTQQKLSNGQSTEPTVNEQSNITGKTLSSVIGLATFKMGTTVPEDASVLKDWANAKLQKSRLSKIKGYVTIPGSTLAKLDSLVELNGFGARFNGSAYISRVTHTLEGGSWTTKIGFGLNDKWFSESHQIVSPAASGLLPGIPGLQIGVVKQIDQDPDGEYRVLVNVPIIEESGDGIWARLSNFYASDGIGNYFYPEVSDEVVLGFLNEDPRFPVILGSLYGKKRKPAYTPDSENKTKGIVTKSQMKLTFDEDKKIITIETPGGNKVTLSDDAKSITMEDQNSNKIEMSDSGITIKSPKDIKITASGSLSAEATSNATIKATGDASVSGNNVNIKANMALTAEGSAQAALKASGQVEVKGAMVMIN
ncbi:VgrG protein [Fulvivirga imtechensis AK7]|uniref:VgrG protein n=1 Tax=Fulvivirga imtechensis AK7 TaxID=1237149 RepID=L8JQG5_9BACT|nr:type VI secretion system tip protein VgrG [Fulvivirga imtechensis]ELR71196.1 VgrG protein [Fulvivirga imtechensis AK7]